MPKACINGINLYYETWGDPNSPPLLLIGGLSAYTRSWDKLLPTLSQNFRVIVFDNRGVGKSDKPPPPYSMDEFAADTLGLLDHLGIKVVDVFGVSMGGMIAQHLALKYPKRVRCLVLGCTSCDGPAILRRPEAAKLLKPLPPQTQERKKALRERLRYLLSPAFLKAYPEEFERLVLEALGANQPTHGYLGQLDAVWGHNTCARLSELYIPTLVMHGTADIIVPLENGLFLAQQIPEARFITFEGAGHLFYVEQVYKMKIIITEFLIGDQGIK